MKGRKSKVEWSDPNNRRGIGRLLVALRVIRRAAKFGRFSNRPFRVKRFQTIHHCSVDVAHGLVLLFGIGTKALVWGFFSQEA
jgi:hypothetical protein